MDHRDDVDLPLSLRRAFAACFRVHSKTAAITGGGTGIGYQVARSFAEAGANIALFYNTSAEAIDKAAGLEKEFGIKAKAYKVPGVISRTYAPFTRGSRCVVYSHRLEDRHGEHQPGRHRLWQIGHLRQFRLLFSRCRLPLIPITDSPFLFYDIRYSSEQVANAGMVCRVSPYST